MLLHGEVVYTVRAGWVGPLEQVGAECPPLSILPKVSGWNGRGQGENQRKPKTEGGGFLGFGAFQPCHITVVCVMIRAGDCNPDK